MTLPALALLLLVPQDVEKAKAAVKKYEQQTYAILKDGKPMGSATLTSRVEGDAMIFDDVIASSAGGRDVRFGLKVTYALDASLTLRSFETSGERVTKGAVQGKTLSVQTATRPKTVELRGATMAGMALLRQIAMLEPKDGVSFAFDELQVEEGGLRKDQKLSYAGTDKVKRGSREVDAAKWTLADGVTFLAIDGVVVKLVAPGTEFVLEEAVERVYRRTTDGKEIGTLTTRTRRDGETLIFEDRVIGKNKTTTIDLMLHETVTAATGATRSFSVVAAKAEATRGTVKGGILTLKLTTGMGEETKEIKLAGDLCTRMGLLRRVAAGEPREGGSITVIVFDPITTDVGAELKITCSGREKVTLGAREREAHKWSGGAMTFWVADGIVVKAVFDERDGLELVEK